MAFSLSRLCGLAAALAVLSAPALAQTAAQTGQMLNNANNAINTATAISPEAAAARAQAQGTIQTVHNSIRTQAQAQSQQITQNLNMDGDQAYHPLHPQNHGWQTPWAQRQRMANQQVYNHNDDEASTNNYPRYRHFSFNRVQKNTGPSMAGYNQD